MNGIFASVDNPVPAMEYSSKLDVRGWACSLRGRITSVDVFLGERHLGTVPYGFPRRDVVAAVAEATDEFCGFDGRISIDDLALGEVEVEVRVRDSHGGEWRRAVAVRIVGSELAELVPGLPVRAIAFYLPQYHPIPENDAWWGKGFTEWTNVVRGRPLFNGHEQPHLPADLGFYDLRVPEVREQQAALARANGIFGFCYHYYWFGGRRLLEKPLDEVLRLGTPDFPFCVCWANENWTRRWDGAEQDVLIAQDHSAEDDEALMRSMLPMFADPRYIRVGAQPMLLVYRPAILPNAAATTKRWRAVCAAAGVEPPYLVAVQSFGLGDPTGLGFDAAVEFPPHSVSAADLTDRMSGRDEAFAGRVFDYDDFARRAASRPAPAYPLFRCVMPSWDNTARRKMTGNVFFGSTPELYERWLRGAVAHAQKDLPDDRRFVFVNAWNEWGEGCHLEPDDRYGDAYLRATRTVLGAARTTPRVPLVSVVVPTYNRAWVLAETLRSVVEQTYENLEIVVVNDGSSDETAQVLAAFGRTYLGRPMRVIHRPNGGAHAALNDGIRAAEGEYVAILNDDDRFHPERVQTLVQRVRGRGARFAFTRCAYIDGLGRPIGPNEGTVKTFRAKQRALGEYPSLGYALLDYNVAIGTGNFFFERSLFDDVGEFASLKYCHDWDFALRTLRFGEPLYVDVDLYEYRLHEGNHSSTLQDLAKIETDRVLSRFFGEDDALPQVPPSYPSRRNFGAYHERFILEHGYWRYQNGDTVRTSPAGRSNGTV